MFSINKLNAIIQHEQDKAWLSDDKSELTEEDFYPPEDTRVLRSGVEDTKDETFADYTKYYFDTYGKEIFDVNW